MRDTDTYEDQNPFADGRSAVPDAMGYRVFGITADGETLCERCIVDPANPVEDHRGRHVDSPTGWEVIAFDYDGNCDGPLSCDHCSRVIVSAMCTYDEGPDADEWCNGGCVTRPHAWSRGGVCTRTGCNVAGTGDTCNDGNCEGDLW